MKLLDAANQDVKELINRMDEPSYYKAKKRYDSSLKCIIDGFNSRLKQLSADEDAEKLFRIITEADFPHANIALKNMSRRLKKKPRELRKFIYDLGFFQEDFLCRISSSFQILLWTELSSNLIFT